MDVDVIAVGGGFAGLIVANRCAQLGLNAAVLEQESAERYICNSRITTGVSHIMFRDMDLPAGTLAPLIAEANRGRADPALVETFAANARRAIEWLEAEGQHFARISTSRKFQNLILAPPRPFTVGPDWEDRGGDVLLRTLETNLGKRKGALLRGTKVTSLAMANGACVGVETVQDGKPVRMAAKAVVLADGGFPANVDMIRQYVTPRAERLLIRAAGNASGDGLRMAQAVGAQLTGFGAFYGHPMHREALTNARLWPFPMMDPLTNAGIVVGADGRRFADEGQGGIVLANAIAALADPLSTTLVFDDDIWNDAGKEVGGANPLLLSAGATLHQAGDLAALAAKAALPEAALADTIAIYNDALGGGRLAALDPPRSTDLVAPTPIRRPPFYAIPLVAGITGSMGGIATDTQCRALRADRSAIRGLYAAGGNVAGLEGGPAVAYMGGLSKAFIFGLLAGEAIAQDLGV
jgi:fumarate reductase flavoprotein subunit